MSGGNETNAAITAEITTVNRKAGTGERTRELAAAGETPGICIVLSGFATTDLSSSDLWMLGQGAGFAWSTRPLGNFFL